MRRSFALGVVLALSGLVACSSSEDSTNVSEPSVVETDAPSTDAPATEAPTTTAVLVPTV
jgi:uncharacterized protein YcfL